MAGTRLQIVASFFVFALAVAPFAWQCTRVERQTLPMDRIQRLQLPSLASYDHIQVIIHSTTKTSVDLPFPVTYHDLKVENEVFKAPESSPRVIDEALRAMIDAKSHAFHVFLLCQPAKASAFELYVGIYRHAWSFACDGSSIQDALHQFVHQHVSITQQSTSSSSRARIATKYRIQFTTLIETPAVESRSNLSTLSDQYLRPLLRELQALGNCTVDYRTMTYARLSSNIQQHNGHFVLPATSLQQFPSQNDFLTSVITDDREPVLHLMVFIPGPSHTPLKIQSDDKKRLASAFELPGAGLVVIQNPEMEAKRLMGLLVNQLRRFFGFLDISIRQNQHPSILFLPSQHQGVTMWEMDALVRSLLQMHMTTTMETLQSIVELVTSYSQMSVLQRVVDCITASVDQLESIFDQISDIKDPVIARRLLLQALAAASEADRAYYDHTMIRQLYFPQEQLFGVYAPLLAPLILPFCLGMVREWKRYKLKIQTKTTVAVN